MATVDADVGRARQGDRPSPHVLSEGDAQALLEVLRSSESWLMQRVLDLAHEHGYTRYTSTLLEAWRMSIQGLTDAVATGLDRTREIPELRPDLDPATDPLGQFGVEEAAKHRQRGVNLGMFLGLFKYYRQAYGDVLAQARDEGRFTDPAGVMAFINRVFDRTELAYTTSWAGTSAERQIHELSQANLTAVNEKNRLLTLIESLHVPALLVAEDGSVEFTNMAAARLLGLGYEPGATHYHGAEPAMGPDWLVDLVGDLGDSRILETEVAVPVGGEDRTFLVFISHMLDISAKFSGFAVVLADVTEDRAQRRALYKASEVLTNTRDGVVVLDARGRITGVNPAFAALAGESGDDLLGRSFIGILDAASAEREPEVSEALSTQGHWSGETTLEPAPGVLVTGWLSLSRIADSGTDDPETVGVFTDVTSLVQTRSQLDHLARHDPLTGLVNRSEIRSLLNDALSTARGLGQRVGVLFLDLDRFKEINDTLGHEVGDEVLIQVAERLHGAIRERDLLGRLGGDEFMVIAEGLTQPEQASLIALKMQHALRRPIQLDGFEHVVSASVGISVFPDDGASADELVRNADSAMYLAKESGRSTHRRYVASLTEEAKELVALRAALRRDVESGTLDLFYQPIISLGTGRLAGVEALMRWQHPDLGGVSPEVFIPLIEEMGMMNVVGEWAVEQAVRQMALWAEQGVSVPLVAVNVAPSQLEDRSFARKVMKAVDTHGLDPSRLQLEVTEGTMFRVRESGSGVLRQLVERGVTVAMDDFGTGYSSLGRLHDLPISVLKIDRSFVAGGLGRSADDRPTLVRAIVGLAHALGLTVTAEGVEDLDAATALADMGCERAQGFAFSAALPAVQFAAVPTEPWLGGGVTVARG